MNKRREIAQEFANLINDNNNIKEIILFGSVTRGENDDDSDIDILIITNHQMEVEDKIAEEIFNVIAKYKELISAHIITENNIMKQKITHS